MTDTSTRASLNAAAAEHPELTRRLFDAIHDQLLTAGIPGVYGSNGCTSPAVNATVAVCIFEVADLLDGGSRSGDYRDASQPGS